MAITVLDAEGINQIKTAGTNNLTVNTGGDLLAGDVIVLGVGFDNTGTSTPTVTASGGTGITWTTQVTGNSNSATSAAACRSAIITGVLSQSVASGTTVTLTFSETITAKSVALSAYRGVDTSTMVRSGTSNSAQGSGTAASVTTGATNPVSGDIVLAVVCSESNTAPGTDSDTTNGSWSNQSGQSMTGGNSATNINIMASFKVVTADGAQTYNQTVASSDWSSSIIALRPSPSATVNASVVASVAAIPQATATFDAAISASVVAGVAAVPAPTKQEGAGRSPAVVPAAAAVPQAIAVGQPDADVNAAVVSVVVAVPQATAEAQADASVSVSVVATDVSVRKPAYILTVSPPSTVEDWAIVMTIQ